MKFINILYLWLLILFVSCGGYEQIITEDGSVYEVKGNKIKSNGDNITETLSYDEREKIKALVDKKRQSEKEAEKLKKELEEKKERQEEIEKEAQEKQKVLEDKKEALEDKLKAKKESRENYIELKKKYDKEHKKYKKLKRKGELSPNDIKDWEEKLNKLKSEVEEARSKLKKFD